jgi:hypothetical protein
MEKTLETIARFASVPEAHLAKNRLAEEGIPAFLADELTINVAWQLSNALGGVKLQVRPEDKELALEILRSTQPLAEHSEDAIPDESRAETDDTPSDEPDIPLNAREETAERAFRAAGLGLIFFLSSFTLSGN